MPPPDQFKPSAAYQAVKPRQDQLTYTPGVVFSLLLVGITFIGEHFGRRPAAVLGAPLLIALVAWWFMLGRASVRTWRTLAAEQRSWKEQRREDAGSALAAAPSCLNGGDSATRTGTSAHAAVRATACACPQTANPDSPAASDRRQFTRSRDDSR